VALFLVFLAIVLLNAFADRFWCRYLCPLGALLGLFAKVQVMRPLVGDGCNRCAACARACSVGAIERAAGGKPAGAPCPTPAAPAGTAAPAPTWAAVDAPARIDQLFHLDNLHWYQYRANIASGPSNLSSLYKFEYSDETYGGIAAKHTRVTSNDTISGLESIGDIYTSKADGRSLGGSVKSFIFGTPLTELSIEAGQGLNYLDSDLANQARANGKAPLTNSGQEKVTVDGTTYTCTRYVYTAEGVTYTAWYTPQAPAPVKVTWIDRNAPGSAHMTLELLGWG
jgi:ferredoxin